MFDDSFLTQDKIIETKKKIIAQSDFLGDDVTPDELRSYDDFLTLKIIQVRDAKLANPDLTKEEATQILLSEPSAASTDLFGMVADGIDVPALIKFIGKYFSRVNATPIPAELTKLLIDSLIE